MLLSFSFSFVLIKLKEVKAVEEKVSRMVEEGKAVSKLVFGGTILEPSQTLEGFELRVKPIQVESARVNEYV